ncbi:MAG: hypothetical protein QXL78_03030 [Methanocellales archaeon]
MPRELEKLFMHEKPARMLLSIKKNKSPNVSIVSRETKSTFAHTEKVLSIFKEFGLVRFLHEGRVKRIALTKSGEQMANAIEILLNLLRKLEREKRKAKQQFKSSAREQSQRHS